MILLYRPKTKNAVKVLQWTGDNKSEIRDAWNMRYIEVKDEQ